VTGERSEEGYALLAAIAAIAIFSTLALAVLGQVQGAILQSKAEIERARADTAAEAGSQLAIQNLAGDNPAFRWPLDSRPHEFEFGGAHVTVRLVDQRGKLPLAALEDKQVRKLFELLDVPSNRIDVVTDSYLDWVDDDDDPRPNGAEYTYYAARHIHPQNSVPQSFEELELIRGFEPALVAKIRAVATLHFGSGTFDSRHASPIAIAVLATGADDSGEDSTEGATEEIDAEREAQGQHVALDIGDSNQAGRTVEVVVEAATPGGGRSRLSQIIELTGNKDRAFAVLEAD
jgi:general secretion pathway protein K